MITVNTCILATVRYMVKEGKREKFYQKVVELGIDAASRREAGNFKYDFYYPVDSANDICLLEIWADAAAQKQHGQTAHYRLLSELKQEYVEKVQIQSYSVCENG